MWRVDRPVGRRAAVLVAALVVALAASGCGSSDPVVKLDGSPRLPDTEGVVVSASASRITLDGNRKYTVSPKLISFSTYNRRAVSLTSTVGKYVQLGLAKNEAKWLALIGVVQADESGRETVVYQGELVRAAGRRFDFKDGTVLRLARGLTPPENILGAAFVVIDAKRHVIQGATFQGASTTTTRTKNS